MSPSHSPVALPMPANLLCELNGHLMPCFYGKWVEDVCTGQFGVFVYLVLCCLVGCCTWFSCCAANVGLSICVTSQAIGFPLAHGRRVVPSGRLLSSRIRLIGSLTAGIRTRLIAVLGIMVMTLSRRRHSACCSRPHLAVLMTLCVFVCSSGFTEACRCVH